MLSYSGTLKNVKILICSSMIYRKGFHVRQGLEAKRASGQYMFPLKCVVDGRFFLYRLWETKVYRWHTNVDFKVTTQLII